MSDIDGGALSLAWAVPFLGMLLSLAVLPGLAPGHWQRRLGLVAALWSAALAVPFAVTFGVAATGAMLAHALLVEYLPFIVLLGSLYVVAGGIRLTGTLRGTPGVNTLLLMIGSVAANAMGTTGAAMVFVRPLLRANRGRRRNAHVFVFFTFLVANIGGALTPLGNPPLLIGFLKGVPFFWPIVHLLLPTLLSAAALLGMFYALDRHLHRRHGVEPGPFEEIERLGIDGKRNLPLLALIPAIVLAMAAARGYAPNLDGFGVEIDLATVLGNLALVAVAAASLVLTRSATHRANHFSARPMADIAMLFAAIFVTVAPVLAIMRAGPRGALAAIVPLVSGTGADAAYFWLTGGLSSLLDSAPTYLVFFNLAGGSTAALTGPQAHTLTAISAGAVFMGAATYVGNAPNLMVKALCEERGVAMPSFLGYIGWAGLVLVPVYLVLTIVFFR